jgi:hypothetical protein
MKLDRHELLALTAWMEATGLSPVAAAKLVKVTPISFIKWGRGGGIRATQLARLRPLISPYMKIDLVQQPAQELSSLREKLRQYEATHPDLIRMYSAVLDQIEVLISRQA